MGRVWADHAFFLGATAENADQLGEWEQAPGCAGVKVFMGSSTGTLLVEDDATLERVLRSGERRVAIHSEDEYRLREQYAKVEVGASPTIHPDVRDVETAVRATTRLLDLVEKTRRKIHLLHVSTAEEVALLRERDLGELVTAEVTPNHLFLEAPDCYERLGVSCPDEPAGPRIAATRTRCGRRSPTARSRASDRTMRPHTLEEKAQPYPKSPSGIPGVQTILPLLLTAVRDGWLSWADVIRVTSTAPAEVYGIRGKGRLEEGFVGDVVVVDPEVEGPLPSSGCARAPGTALRGAPPGGLAHHDRPARTRRLPRSRHGGGGARASSHLRIDEPVGAMMSRLEILDGTNWEEFLAAPVSVLMLARSDCPQCTEWEAALEAFLAKDTRWVGVRFGRMVLDRGRLGSFKRAHDWVADLRGLPYTLISVEGEPVRDFVEGSIEVLTSHLAELPNGESVSDTDSPLGDE